jgi:hypothetical protein
MNEKENLMYIAIRNGLNSKPELIPATSKLEEVIKSFTKDGYQSLYHYNETHKKILEERQTLSGITDTVTKRLFFDFDSKDNLEVARQDAVETANRLITKGFPEESIQCFFTGSKGFNIEVALTDYITPDKFGAIVDNIAGDLKTFDVVVREANRIVRIVNTKHQTTNLYKIPLTPEELVNMSVDDIKTLAKKRRTIETEVAIVSLPEELKTLKTIEKTLESVKTELSFDISEVNMKERPKGLDEARWLLSNGFFKSGERNNAMLCLAATYHNQKFPYEVTKGILDGVAELQSQRTGEDKFQDREMDLILKQVYGPNWKGGTFTTRDPSNWLAKYAMKMKLNIREEYGPQTLDGIHDSFMHYVNNIEKNTIKTGIPLLDKTMPITIGSNIGIVAAAGAGKTALALKILKYNSEQGIPTVFCSLDMVKNRLFEKVLYNVTGLSRDDLYAAFKKGEGKQLTDLVKKHYGNVWFYDRSSATIPDIRSYILDVEQKSGLKVKMVMLDYFERINTDVSDDTASSKKLANEIQDMVNDHDIAAITLVQPNKFSLGGGPDTEIVSYTSIKGSSFLYQSFRGIISLSRPFYTPATKDIDKFCICNVLKNDLGEQARLIFGWNGKKGDIYPLEDAELQEFNDLMKMKNDIKKGESNGWD